MDTTACLVHIDRRTGSGAACFGIFPLPVHDTGGNRKHFDAGRRERHYAAYRCGRGNPGRRTGGDFASARDFPVYGAGGGSRGSRLLFFAATVARPGKPCKTGKGRKGKRISATGEEQKDRAAGKKREPVLHETEKKVPRMPKTVVYKDREENRPVAGSLYFKKHKWRKIYETIYKLTARPSSSPSAPRASSRSLDAASAGNPAAKASAAFSVSAHARESAACCLASAMTAS